VKRDRQVAEGPGHHGGMGGRKWDEYKPGKSKAIRLTRARVKIPLGDQNIPEASSCKYLGIILSKRFKLGGQSKRHSAKRSLEGTSLCNAW